MLPNECERVFINRPLIAQDKSEIDVETVTASASKCDMSHQPQFQ